MVLIIIGEFGVWSLSRHRRRSNEDQVGHDGGDGLGRPGQQQIGQGKVHAQFKVK
jgi:hypothetical protein